MHFGNNLGLHVSASASHFDLGFPYLAPSALFNIQARSSTLEPDIRRKEKTKKAKFNKMIKKLYISTLYSTLFSNLSSSISHTVFSILFFTLFIIGSIQVFANELSTPDTHRIQSLLPKGITLNIEPYIPNDFMLVKPTKEEFFWMPDGSFEKYMSGSKSPHSPFIHVMIREGFKDFKTNNGKNPMKESVAEMKRLLPVSSTLMRWGDYEVISIKMNATDDDEYMAFVDLNRDDGNFLIFHLGYSKKLDYGHGNKPNKDDLDFWNDFLEKTKPLYEKTKPL